MQLSLLRKAPPSAASITGNSSPFGTGDSITLTCVVTGGNPPPTIQWHKDGSSLSGETLSTLTFLGSSSAAGDYSCQATNILGQVSSPPETLVITGI